MRICTRDGCREPVKISRTGNELTMCDEHQQEYWREKAEQRRRKKGTQPKSKKAAPAEPKPKKKRERKPKLQLEFSGSEAQVVEGFGRTIKAGEGQPMLLIDWKKNRVVLGRMKVQSTHELSTLKCPKSPKALAALLNLYEERGYFVLEIGDRSSFTEVEHDSASA